ncbi:MAG: hypothetical protein ACI4PF_01740 [Christensenellales bacterium]
MEKSKKGLGVVLGLFLNILGLLFALLFKKGSNERKTFIKGWLIGFIISIVVCCLLVAGYFIMVVVVFKGIANGIQNASSAINLFM